MFPVRNDWPRTATLFLFHRDLWKFEAELQTMIKQACELKFFDKETCAQHLPLLVAKPATAPTALKFSIEEMRAYKMILQTSMKVVQKYLKTCKANPNLLILEP